MDIEDISTEEAIFIMFREDIRHLYSKWDNLLENIGYVGAPTTVCNNMIKLDEIFKDVDRKLDCEK